MADDHSRFRRRTGRRIAVALFFALGVLTGGFGGWSAPVRAESGSVRYSYENVELGPRPQWVLVPKAESALKGKVTEAKVRKAFSLLRDEKEKTYGETSIEVGGSAPDDLTATVRIDPDYARFKLIIIAESVYTLTELGVDEIRFPDFAEGSVTRADVPFSAYTPTLPLWRALPETSLVDARVRMPDGEVHTAESVYTEWNKDKSKLGEALYSYLDASQPYTVRQVTEKLPKLGIPFVDQVVPLLEHDNEKVRRTALKTLESKRNTPKVSKAVVSLMEAEERSSLARKAAEFLGKAEDERFSVQRWFFLLEHGKHEERLRAAEKLGGWSAGDDRVVTRLNEALLESNDVEQSDSAAESGASSKGASAKPPNKRKQNEQKDAEGSSSKKEGSKAGGGAMAELEAFESAVAEALVERDAHGPLARSLDKESVLASTKEQIASALSEDPKPQARIPGLRYIAGHADGKRARESLRTLGTIDLAAAREAVESFLTTEDRRLRLTAIETVDSIGSLKSLPAIADAIRSGPGHAQKLEDVGYRLIAEQKIPDVLDYTRKSDVVVQRMAYRAVGAKLEEGVPTDQVFETLFDTIKKGTKENDPKIRGAAARSLGTIGSDKALEVLKTLAKDDSPVVRQGVAYALANYDKGTMSDTLTSYLEDDSPKVVTAAIDTLTERKEGSAWDTFKKLANAENPKVRQRALEAVAKLVPDDDKAQRKVISLLSGTVTSDDNQAVLRTALEQLGRFKKKRAVNGIAINLNAKEKGLRLTAIRALGRTGHSSAKELLLEQLGSSDPAIRRATVKALRDLGDPSVRSTLQQRLTKEKNEDIKGLIEETLDEL